MKNDISPSPQPDPTNVNLTRITDDAVEARLMEADNKATSGDDQQGIVKVLTKKDKTASDSHPLCLEMLFSFHRLLTKPQNNGSPDRNDRSWLVIPFGVFLTALLAILLIGYMCLLFCKNFGPEDPYYVALMQRVSSLREQEQLCSHHSEWLLRECADSSFYFD